MSYFYTQAHVQLMPHRGIGAGRVAAQGGVANQRDANMWAEANRIAAAPGKFAELHDAQKCVAATRGLRHMGAPGFTGDNVMQEPPARKVLPRVRPGLSEEELRRIWAEDERKAEAARRMARGPNYVDKMTTHATSPLTEYREPARVGVRIVAPVERPEAVATFEPDGLKGVGAQSAPEKMHGRRAPTAADFAVPDFQPKKRTNGVRTSGKPRDTLVLG